MAQRAKGKANRRISNNECRRVVWLAQRRCLRRVLLNLVTNALDACIDNSGNKVKKVMVRALKKRKWGVEYQVEDTGCGMDTDVKKRIFQSFFSTKGTDGTGIGLMITKKIIDEHKGQIIAVSKVGVGSTFVIRLPKQLKKGAF